MLRAEPSERPPRRRHPLLRRLVVRLLTLVLLVLFTPVAMLALLRMVDPPISAFMLAERLVMWSQLEAWVPLRRRWVDYEQIAPAARLAVVAAEDQKFPEHHGFDIDSIEAAIDTWMAGGRLRGASTISQQVARNLFLWRARSLFRKGLEAWLTLWLETLWDKRRILEVYLNIAEMGHGVYGVQAAAREHFDKDRILSRWSALLSEGGPHGPQR